MRYRFETKRLFRDAVNYGGTNQARLLALNRGYLSRSHCDSRRTGCAIAALASEAGRGDHNARRVMAHLIDAFIATVGDAMDEQDDAQAMAAVSATVGAVTPSRVATDPARADALLRAVRNNLLAQQTPDAE